MLIVVPVSSTDYQVLSGFVSALKYFGPYPNNNVLIVCRPIDIDYAKEVFSEIGNLFKQKHIHVFAENGKLGWPHGPNFYWAQTIKYLSDSKNESPWLWMEMDCIPVKNNWIKLLEQEYDESPMKILGVIQENVPFFIRGDRIKTGEHVNGVAIYPPDLHKILPEYVNVLNSDTAFDTLFMVPLTEQAQNTNQIQFCYRTIKYKWVNNELVGEQNPEWARNRLDDRIFNNPISSSAVLVHGCEDGSLSRLIQRPDSKTLEQDYDDYENINNNARSVLQYFCKKYGDKKIPEKKYYIPVHLHIPKCAGTYVKRGITWLAKFYGSDKYGRQNLSNQLNIWDISIDIQEGDNSIQRYSIATVWSYIKRDDINIETYTPTEHDRQVYKWVSDSQFYWLLENNKLDIFSMSICSNSMNYDCSKLISAIETHTNKKLKYFCPIRDIKRRILSMYYVVIGRDNVYLNKEDRIKPSKDKFLDFMNENETNWISKFLFNIFSSYMPNYLKNISLDNLRNDTNSKNLFKEIKTIFSKYIKFSEINYINNLLSDVFGEVYGPVFAEYCKSFKEKKTHDDYSLNKTKIDINFLNLQMDAQEQNKIKKFESMCEYDIDLYNFIFSKNQVDPCENKIFINSNNLIKLKI